MCPFRWKLSACTFTWCHLFLRILENEICNFGWNLPLATFGRERVKQLFLCYSPSLVSVPTIWILTNICLNAAPSISKFPSLSILLSLHQNFLSIFRLFDMKLQKTIPWVVNLKEMLNPGSKQDLSPVSLMSLSMVSTLFSVQILLMNVWFLKISIANFLSQRENFKDVPIITCLFIL